MSQKTCTVFSAVLLFVLIGAVLLGLFGNSEKSEELEAATVHTIRISESIDVADKETFVETMARDLDAEGLVVPDLEEIGSTTMPPEITSTKTSPTSDETLEKFNGFYKITRPDTDNFDAYLAAVGVPWIMRFVGKGINQDVRMKAQGEHKIRIETISSIANSDQVFTLNEPVAFTSLDRRSVIGTWTLPSKNPPTLNLHETWKQKTKEGTQNWVMVQPGVIELTLCCEGKCATRVYEKQ